MKFFKYAYYLFLGCLALVALLLVVSAFPVSGNFQVRIVQSGSMEPAVKTGALLVVKPADSYDIGNIITFKKGTEVITHRIVDMEVTEGDLRYVVQGDANNAPDSDTVRQRAIIGKALFSIPYLGYVVEAAKTPFGFAFIVVVPAAIIISDELKKIWREVKKMKK